MSKLPYYFLKHFKVLVEAIKFIFLNVSVSLTHCNRRRPNQQSSETVVWRSS